MFPITSGLRTLRERHAVSTQHANQSLARALHMVCPKQLLDSSVHLQKSLGREELLLAGDLSLTLHTKVGCAGQRAHTQNFPIVPQEVRS